MWWVAAHCLLQEKKELSCIHTPSPALFLLEPPARISVHLCVCGRGDDGLACGWWSGTLLVACFLSRQEASCVSILFKTVLIAHGPMAHQPCKLGFLGLGIVRLGLEQGGCRGCFNSRVSRISPACCRQLTILLAPVVVAAYSFFPQASPTLSSVQSCVSRKKKLVVLAPWHAPILRPKPTTGFCISTGWYNLLALTPSPRASRIVTLMRVD